MAEKIKNIAGKWAEPFGRAVLFIIYFWFGILKVIGLSPASGLVKDLLAQTLPFITPHLFITLLGVFEMVIGVLFLSRRADRLTIPLFFIHMLTTFMPLLLLPQETWSGPLAPTLEGQYIVKNVALIAIVLNILARKRSTN